MDSPQKFETAYWEGKQTCNLKGEACNKDMCSKMELRQLVRLLLNKRIWAGEQYHRLISYRCWSCNSSPGSLNTQSDKITSHEEHRVRSRLYPTNLFAINNNNPAKTYIDRSCNEDGAEGQANEVPHKVDFAEWIVMQQYSSDITRWLRGQAKKHCHAHESSLVIYSQDKLSKSESINDQQEENIPGHAWLVVNIAPFRYVAGPEVADEAWDVIGGNPTCWHLEESFVIFSDERKKMREKWKSYLLISWRFDIGIAGHQQDMIGLVSWLSAFRRSASTPLI